MNFTDKELEVIKKANIKVRRAAFSAYLTIAFLVILFILLITDFLEAEYFAYLAFAMCVITIMQPQMGNGPKYQDLVALLISKSTNKDQLIEILESSNKSKT